MRFLGGAAGLVLGSAAVLVVFALVARVMPVLSTPDAAWLEGTVHPRVRPAVTWICRPLAAEITR